MNTSKRPPVVNYSLLFLLICLLSHPYAATALTLTTGQVFGQITAPSGAVVPQAKIELRDSATGVLRTASADAAGQYAFAQITPGLYSITVTASGFAKTFRSARRRAWREFFCPKRRTPRTFVLWPSIPPPRRPFCR